MDIKAVEHAVKEIAVFFIERSKFTLFLLFVVVVFGAYAYFAIAREKIPEVKVPVVMVNAVLDGLSPGDVERLLVIPIEREVKSVSGVKKVVASARDGVANIAVELHSSGDLRAAMDDIRAKLDVLRSKLPRGVTALFAEETDLSLFPVFSIALVGTAPERSMLKIARELKARVEALRDVLGVDIAGLRKDVVEVIFSPELIHHYNLKLQDIVLAISRNHVLLSSGSLESVVGSHQVRVLGLLNNYEKIANLPVKVDGGSVVTIGDVAKIRPALEDVSSLIRVNGKPCMVLEVSKRSGSDIMVVARGVRGIVQEAKKLLPDGVSLYFLRDQSLEVLSILNELENTIVFSVALVVLVVVCFMGLRTATLVSLSIPVSFLLGMVPIYLMGYTLNMVTLFSLIMVVGMLVDDAIVVSEYADRKMVYGFSSKESFKQAASDMFSPIATSTVTRLVVFIPLLFWPGTTGFFMKYIPVASVFTIMASWVMAVVFTPVFGSMFGRPSVTQSSDIEKLNAIEYGDISKLGRVPNFYAKVLNKVLDHPGKFVFVVVSVLVSATAAYFLIGPGVEFFPKMEPSRAVIEIKSDSNLSIWEKDSIMKEAEERVLGVDGVKFFYTKSGEVKGRDDSGILGVIQVEFQDWNFRRKATEILLDISKRLSGMQGITIDIVEEKEGPNKGKSLKIDLSSSDEVALEFAAGFLESIMKKSKGFTGVVRDDACMGVEWRIDVDRRKAAMLGADVSVVGELVKMLTHGVTIGKYYPSNSSMVDEVDIVARFPKERRVLNAVDGLFVNTAYGPVSVSNFVTKKAVRRTKEVKRVNGTKMVSVFSEIQPGYLVSERVEYLKGVMQNHLDPRVIVDFTGDVESRAEAGGFLIKAFGFVVLLMVLVLMWEFNSFYYVFVVMTAVFLSTTCVFLGFLLTYRVFGVVMGGVGIIVLAGVVVNNNILLIDAFRANLRKVTKKEAIIRSAISRLRPIFLTVITGVLGLLPMVFRVSIDFLHLEVLYDSPSSQLWVELSSAISMGLLMATGVTLLFTPAVLMLGNTETKLSFKSFGEV